MRRAVKTDSFFCATLLTEMCLAGLRVIGRRMSDGKCKTAKWQTIQHFLFCPFLISAWSAFPLRLIGSAIFAGSRRVGSSIYNFWASSIYVIYVYVNYLWMTVCPITCSIETASQHKNDNYRFRSAIWIQIWKKLIVSDRDDL